MQHDYGRAGLDGIDDLDVAEIHDCFSFNGIVTIERMGLAAPGTRGAAVAEGGISRGGRLLINPGGPSGARVRGPRRRRPRRKWPGRDRTGTPP